MTSYLLNALALCRIKTKIITCSLKAFTVKKVVYIISNASIIALFIGCDSITHALLDTCLAFASTRIISAIVS